VSITAGYVDGRIGRGIQNAVAPATSLASIAQRITNTIGSGESMSLDFLGSIPGMAKWADKRRRVKPVPYSWALQNDKFESSIVIPDEWLIADKTSNVDLRISQLVEKYSIWPGALVATLINNSATALAFDGKAFFASDHVWGDSGTIDNAIDQAAASGTTPTADEFAIGIMAAYAQMLGFKDDLGEPVNENISSLAVVCGATLAGTAMQAINGDQLDTGTGTRDNPIKGMGAQGVNIRLLANPRITSTTKFYLVKNDANACPFIFGENPALMNRTTKDNRHDNDEWEFGVKAVGNATYGLFTDAVEVTFT
jgi:phage major head subunit gpT-like protein